MRLKTTKLLPKFLILIIMFACIISAAFITSGGSAVTNADGGTGKEMSLVSVFESKANETKYGNSSYSSYYKLPSSDVKEVVANGASLELESAAFPVTNVLDGSAKTFWYSASENTDNFKNSLEFTFVSERSVESVYYSSSYYTRGQIRHFAGYPVRMNVYASLNGGNYELVGEYSGNPVKDFSEAVVFTLPKAVACDKLKIEFAEVSTVTGIADWLDGKKLAAANNIFFFKPDEGVEFIASGNATGNYANTTYLAANSVSASEMKFRANGAGEIANAFDKNVGTYWTSESANTELFKNKVSITFNSATPIEKIVMGLSYYTRNGSRNYSGYPKVLKVYTAADDTGDLLLTKLFSGDPGGNWGMACFDFGEAVTCKRLTLEFTDVTVFSEVADGAPVACSSEIYLVRVADESVNEILESINGMFSDYAQLSLKPEYTADSISELRAAVKNNSSYESTLKPLLDRAEAVLNGAVRKDIYREFSTDPNAKNSILRMGDLRGYCYNTLKHSSFGTNRQLTGIAANTGEKLTIYVDAEEGDPLPKIACTQIYGAWNSWKAEYQLHKGKNEITFPNLKAHGNYSRAIAPGGPLHIINSYTEEQQSANVKVYIEGGALYPVFRDGDDEETFKMILRNYYNRLTDPDDSGVTVDCFEAVTGNVMLSCTASLAYASYVKGGSSPQYNIDKWRRYITGLLTFGGVELEEGQPYYDVRNQYIKVNIRAVQPYAGMYAFAAADHVGIIDSATFGAMVQMWTTGWAFAHEVGHMLDNMNMKRPEITNNMWAIYDIYMQNGAFNDRINVTNVSRNLASDFSEKVGKYWSNGNSNCDFWWIIEGGHPGYWAKLQRLYCFDKRGDDLSDTTERLAYYSSIATGEDMTQYFERWGFYLHGDTEFVAANVSDKYKQKMAEAKSKGWVTGEGKKYWYVNNEQYRQEKLHGGKLDASWAGCYNSSQIVTAQISQSGANYSLRLPDPANATAHLCYEVQGYVNGGWKVLGVTYGTVFNDTYAWGNATPKYRVYAYDRMLNHTGDPAEQTPSEQERQFDVCRIGEVKYNSLKEAVAAANEGDIIYLLKDFSDGNITINKPLKIRVDPLIEGDSVTITKNAGGTLINVVNGNRKYTVEINSKDSTKKIILDGGGFSQSGALLQAAGSNSGFTAVNAYKTEFRNNFNSGNGGACYVGYIGQILLVDCVVADNRAANGAGAYLEGSNPGWGRTQFALFNTIFENNVASANGGAIYSSSKNGTVFTVNETSNNDPAASRVILRNNQAVNGGGIYADNIINLRFLTLEGNVATGKGGGIYFARVENVLNTATVNGNTSGDGKSDAFYLGNTVLRLNGGKISDSVERSDKSTLKIEAAMPDFTDAVFYLPAIPEEGTAVVDAVTGFTLAQEHLSAMTVANADTKIDGTAIKAVSKIAEITVDCGGEKIKTKAPFGSFTLPESIEGLSKEKYIESWTVDGKKLNVGDKITVTGDLTVTADVKDYYVITLSYGGKTTKMNVTQNYVYYLPMETPDGDVVFGWRTGNREYAYAEGVEITGNVTVEAIVKVKFTVTTDILGTVHTSEYDYGSSFTLPAPPLMMGKAFSHWEVNGDKYPADSTLSVTGNLNVKAHYTATWNVTRIIEDEETVKVYDDGTVIVLDKPEASLGREFVYWSIGGSKYYAGANYTVSGDVEMQAVFINPARLPDELTVTLVFNRGAVSNGDNEGEGEIQENETQTHKVKFNSQFTFNKIEVNEGYVFLYWEVNGAKYYAGDKITVTASFTANASVVEKTVAEPDEGTVEIKLQMYKNGEMVETTYFSTVGEKIYLGEVNDPDGKQFLHWEVDGQAIEGNSFTVTNATSVKAVYKKVDGGIGGNDVDNEGNGGNGGKNPAIGLIIGIVAGVVVIGAAAAVTVVILKKKRK